MDTPLVHESNAHQAAYWNGPAGRRWLDRQVTQDQLLSPISELLLKRARAAEGERVIDIGCGCGATTIALAREVGARGHVVGLDISAPMLARARQRAQPGMPLEFILADATVHRFEPAGADLLFSRFGVMFFADPVLSFTNVRKGLASGARVVFACWREPRENPWMMLPLQQAYKHVPRIAETGPEDPGPFAFASEQRVQRILREAGFCSIAMEACNLSLDIAVGRGLEAAVDGSLATGPVSRALEGQPPERTATVAAAIRAALAPLQRGNAVPLDASVWIATATVA
jgi:ubiquinone/menaquinone biosynthesis C-methylase UbiE